MLTLVSPLALQGANEKNFERYQLAEIKHSRLAMIAFSGFTHQARCVPLTHPRPRMRAADRAFISVAAQGSIGAV